MADVYERLHEKAGVCLSTLGPGAVNAYLDRAPLVAITGQASSAIQELLTNRERNCKRDGCAEAQVEGGRQAVAAPFNKYCGDQRSSTAEQGGSDVVADREAGIA